MLEQLLPERTWRLSATCAKLRHRYIFSIIKHKNYYDYLEDDLLDDSVKHTEKIKIFSFEKHKEFKIFLSKKSLFKFAAHIVNPSHPMLKIAMSDLDNNNLREDFYFYLRQKLQVEKFCNGDFLNTKLIEEQFLKFKMLIFQELLIFLEQKNVYRFVDVKFKNEYFRNFTRAFEFESIMQELKSIEKKRKILSGFHPQHALVLFLKILVVHEYGLEDRLLLCIKKVIADCLQISFMAEQIKKSKLSHNETHKQWLDLAKVVVFSLKNKPRNLLIQVITPVKLNDNTDFHVIYVAIKYLENINNFQIIITNGGSAVKEFHEISPVQDPYSRKAYRYAAFESFNIDDCAEVLEQYVYLLISLKYRANVQEKQGNNDCYLNLLRHVYLREVKSDDGEFFLGFQYKKYTFFKRKDLDECFLTQLTGNCTIHNLKKSLQILFDLDQLKFGLLEGTLILGLDQLISSASVIIGGGLKTNKNGRSSDFPIPEESGHINVSAHGNNGGLFALALGLKRAVDRRPAKALPSHNDFLIFMRQYGEGDLTELTQKTEGMGQRLRQHAFQALTQDETFKAGRYHNFVPMAIHYVDGQLPPFDMEAFWKPNQIFLDGVRNEWQVLSPYLEGFHEDCSHNLSANVVEGQVTGFLVLIRLIIGDNTQNHAEAAKRFFEEHRAKKSIFKLYQKAWARVEEQDAAPAVRQRFNDTMAKCFRREMVDRLIAIPATETEKKVREACRLGFLEGVNFKGQAIQPSLETMRENARSLLIESVILPAWPDIYQNYLEYVRDTDVYLSADELGCLAKHWNVQLKINFGNDARPPYRSYSQANSALLGVVLCNPSQAHWMVDETLVGHQLSDSMDEAQQPPLQTQTSAPQATQTILTNQLALPEGLQYEPIPGDGHCLYHAVALYLGRSQEVLRSEVADYIQAHEHEAEFSGILNALIPQGSTIHDYTRDVREGVEWADNLEIVILGRIYNRPIIVIDPNGGIRNPDAVEIEGEPIFVYYNGHNHYDGLVNTGNRSGIEILTEINTGSAAQNVSDAPTASPRVLLFGNGHRQSVPALMNRADSEEEDLTARESRKRANSAP